MATTTNGIIYPTSSDNIAPLETHFANLASSTDDAIAEIKADLETQIQSGSTSFTGGTSAGDSVTVTVTFATAFTAIPEVVATVQGSGTVQTYAVMLNGTPTINGFTARVYKIAGSTAETDLKLNWFAK